MQATNDNPVLNNPYEEPKYYYDTVRGNLDYNKVLKGRRPYMGNIDITPSSTRGEGEFFSDSDFSDSNDPNVPFINSIRDDFFGMLMATVGTDMIGSVNFREVEDE